MTTFTAVVHVGTLVSIQCVFDDFLVQDLDFRKIFKFVQLVQI